jgi:hypothetical protein
MTQSSLCTGTWLLGFRGVGGGVVSHLRTEDDTTDLGIKSGRSKERRPPF